MPPKGKLKNAPNQHDKRHESGLAAPGRRVTKQRSNTHLNGQSNGKPAHAVQPLPSPTAAVASGAAFPTSPNDTTANSTDPLASQPSGESHAAPVHTAQHRDRTASDASFEEVVSPSGDMADTVHDYASQAPHAEAQPAANKSSSPPAGSTLAIVSTILTYYPLRDAISILILLLSLPPTLVLVIQTLFASLTFVPPTAGISLSTLPNVKDMFNASSLGYPALATILVVDLIFYLCWLPVWKPMQSMFLDLSQTVIAVSLSGAASSNGGPTYSILTCSTVVCVVHMLRYKAIHLTALDYLRSVLHRMDFGFDVNVPSAASSFLFSSPSQHGWFYTAVRTMLGIHIVSQGVTTCIRRSLASANERSSNTPSIVKSDPEAAAGADSAPRSYSADDLKHPPPTSNGDARPPGPSLAHRESKVRESSSKKKRKQANQVRSQQPLWAAIASTKVTFVKEMEQRDAADDAKEAASMDNDTNDTHTNSSTNSTDRIWTCEVHNTDILFGVELTSQSAAETVKDADDISTISAGIDKSKPFFIRVNGAAWSSTKIIPSKSDSTGKWWGGEIFGLAPLSSYHCEVIGIASQRVLCAVNLITLPAPMAEQTTSAPAQPSHQALRPSSPITTLRQSIQQAESKLSETRNRFRKSKKDQRTNQTDIKREITALRSKVDPSGGMDEKQLRRQQQITQHKNQAEDATVDLKTQIDTMGELPTDEVAASEKKRRAWQSALDARTSANRELENAKAEAEREMRELKSEISGIASKREKLVARRQQRSDEFDQALSKQQADQSAKFKHESDRAQKRQDYAQQEGQLQFHVENMQAEIDSLAQKSYEAFQQANALQNWGTGVPPGFTGLSSPPTPENQMPNTNGTLSPHSNFSAYGSMQPNGFHPTVPAPRGRSSSMLSQYSGFTDNGEDYVFEPRQQHTWPMQGNAVAGAAVNDERGQSEGSGSGGNGSTASNSPKPDAKAKPFIPAASRPSFGPVGKKSSQSAGMTGGR